jgi:DNA adenine methylase
MKVPSPLRPTSSSFSDIRHRGSLIAFPYFGGKYSHLPWLLPLIPPAKHYVELFGGSGAVLLNREPALIETFNDLDGDVVNFFRVLRDPVLREELLLRLRLTPFSRQELREAIGMHRNNTVIDDPLERARLYYVRARQSRGPLTTGSVNSWGFIRDLVRRNLSAHISQWLSGVDMLSEVATRLLTCQIECRPALEVVALYDGPDVLMYADPPYIAESRHDPDIYTHEMDEREHFQLSEALHRCKARVALSGYRSPLYDAWYADWRRVDRETTSRVKPGMRTVRTESLWMNY